MSKRWLSLVASVLMVAFCGTVAPGSSRCVRLYAASNTEPEPYTKEEFPQWAHDLRRVEVITLGSFPFTVLFANLSYSVYNYAAHNFDSAYFPNPFARSSAKGGADSHTQKVIVSVAAGVSVVFGLVDLWINLHKRNTANKGRLQKETDARSGVQIEGWVDNDTAPATSASPFEPVSNGKFTAYPVLSFSLQNVPKAGVE